MVYDINAIVDRCIIYGVAMTEALIFSVEEFSLHDGPGVRATVFLKGCPLRCEWCHNPEGQRFENELVKSQAGCENCGACVKAGGGRLNEKSVDVCPNRLLRMSAEPYTPARLLERLRRLLPILNDAGGGVTFSGGEPLAQPDFLQETLALLEGQTHRAVQTSGYCDADTFRRVLGQTDYFLYDLKLLDPALHKRYTGADNAPILGNFQILCGSGKPFITRIPLIPGVTDTEENLAAAARFLRENGVNTAELLPYNRLAGSKYASVGRRYAPGFDETVLPQARTDIFRSFGVEPRVLWGDHVD